MNEAPPINEANNQRGIGVAPLSVGSATVQLLITPSFVKKTSGLNGYIARNDNALKKTNFLGEF